MLFFTNINSVATYESKLLIRSWFFKVFTVLSVLVIGFMDFIILFEQGGWNWDTLSIPANIPYFNLMMLNVGQAVIAIFLASDFLKRDKKLDTSEVFYVHPLSNAEYVIGKIWGIVKVFILLDVLILMIALTCNFILKEVTIDALAYLYYFLIICLPTLIFILGLSIFLMLAFNNQALTFITLLGYIGVTVFYIKEQFYYLFDYMAFNFPLVKSTIVGFSNLEEIILQRSIYLFLGLGFIAMTIVLFKRLPNSSTANRRWIAVAVLMFIAAGASTWKYVHDARYADTVRQFYTELNNQYVEHPKIVVDKYQINIEQQPDSIIASADITGSAVTTSDKFLFTLNPGLKVTEVTENGQPLKFETNHQLLFVDMGRQIEKDSALHINIAYRGNIDQNYCYLDIPEEVRIAPNTVSTFTYDKQYAFLKPNFALLTPETYWYPRPGSGYSSTNPSWQQTYFSDFEIDVKPLPGLLPISQGNASLLEDSLTYRFTPDFVMQSASLVIGNYEKKSLISPSDSIEYSIYNIVGNDYFSKSFDSLRIDTIPKFIDEIHNNLYRNFKLEYPFLRFSVVEVPIQFSTFERSWTQAQEAMQPEMVLFPERGSKYNTFGFEGYKKRIKEWSRYDSRQRTEVDFQIELLNNFLWTFMRKDADMKFEQGGGRGKYNVSSTGVSPHYIFPQVYNFKYNIYSDEWSIANRMIEVYLQQNSAQKDWSSIWRRNINGLSDDEKSSLLMQKRTFKDLIADPEQRYLTNSLLGLKAGFLFAPAEKNIGIEQFKDTVYQILDHYAFENVKFETLLDTLGSISKSDLRAPIKTWNEVSKLPLFEVSTPDVIKINDRGSESYEFSIEIKNTSDCDGVVKIAIPLPTLNSTDGKNMTQVVDLAPHQKKRIVAYFEQMPRSLNVNTLVSGNLPNVITINIQDISAEKRTYQSPEGESIVPEDEEVLSEEIIVDNEDENLFILSEGEPMGYIPRWLDMTANTDIKYSGLVWWNPPLEWTAVTNEQYYGTSVRSAHVIKSGIKNQSAIWKIPLPEHGQYDIFFYLNKPEEMRWRRGGHEKIEYHLEVIYDHGKEDAYIDLNRFENGWVQLGSYTLECDTVQVKLYTDAKCSVVTADAVKVESRVLGRAKPKRPDRQRGMMMMRSAH